MMSKAYAASAQKTLVYCSEGSPSSFDPGQSLNDTDYTAAAETLYNQLIDFEYGGSALKPSLAERWEISEDGKVYTFHLRHGVKFHTTRWFTPTREFNSEDVLFTFERMRNPQMPFRKAHPTEFPYWSYAGFDQVIEKLEAPDPYTVRFTLKAPDASFLTHIADSSLSILSAEYGAQLLKSGTAAQISQKPIGTGPFVFDQYVKDATIRFKGNPEYWKPEDVQLSELIFSITPDAKVRAQKLIKNECQVMVDPHFSDLDALRADLNVRVLSQPDIALNWLSYNTAHKPLDDVRVRQALDGVIDKKAIIHTVYKGHARVAVAPVPPASWAHEKNLKDMPLNLKQAKALLAQAGYPRGFTITLWAMPITRPYNPSPRLMAQMIQADWAKIGVRAQIRSPEWGEYLRQATSGKHDAILMGNVNGKNEPSAWFRELSCSAAANSMNLSRWCHPPFEALIRKAVHTLDPAKRAAFYSEAQKIFKDKQPATMIAYPVMYQAILKNVTGFRIHPVGTTVFSGVSIKNFEEQ